MARFLSPMVMATIESFILMPRGILSPSGAGWASTWANSACHIRLRFDSEGRLYVADRNNARIQVFHQSGEWLDEWRNLIVPWHIWITPRDEIYVCGSTPMRWTKVALLGTVLEYPPRTRL